MDLSSIKLLSIILVLAIAIIAAWIPFKKRLDSLKGHEFPRGEALASGVFLGAGLIHMLGDSANEFSKLGYHYPFAFLLCGISFLVLLLLEHFGSEIQHHGNKDGKSFAILAVVMLSIHSLFAGAALGLSANFSTMILILIAIIAHKWAASFSLAVQINKSSMNIKLGMIYFAIFALMAPLGILIGDNIELFSKSYGLVQPTLTAIAAGTFLYIGTLHGLKRSVMVERCCNLRDFSFVIIGFVLMALAAIYT